MRRPGDAFRAITADAFRRLLAGLRLGAGRATWRDELLDCWRTGRQVFLAATAAARGNAIHLANDFLYGCRRRQGSGLRVHALSANPSVLTCLANDEGYDQIFSLQLGGAWRARAMC